MKQIYSIRSSESRKVLDVDGASHENGAQIHQYDFLEHSNQLWRFEALQGQDTGWYHIVSEESHKCLDVAGASMDDGGLLNQYDCHSGDNQKWRFISMADGAVVIEAKHSGKVLDVPGLSHANSVQIQQYARNDGPNQRWILEAVNSVGHGNIAPPIPIAIAPEFAGIGLQLASNQGIVLGPPLAGDTRGPNITHFQIFAGGGECKGEIVGGTTLGDSPAKFGSIEIHGDQSIYVSYVPTCSPEWYEIARANDTDDIKGKSRTLSFGCCGDSAAFQSLKDWNVDERTWVRAARALPRDLGPAPRWLKLQLPPSRISDPCNAERQRLALLEDSLAHLSVVKNAPGRKPEHVHDLDDEFVNGWHQRHDDEMTQLRARLLQTACRPRANIDWLTFLKSASPAELLRVVPHATPPLPNSGDYCFRDWVERVKNSIIAVAESEGSLDPAVTALYGWAELNTCPPEWNTIMPSNWRVRADHKDNGEKTYNGRTLYWKDLVELEQRNPDAARAALRWNGHPSRGSWNPFKEDDIHDRSIDWNTSFCEGIVTNSFLSGDDPGEWIDHIKWPGTPPDNNAYWPGDSWPLDTDANCNSIDAKHAMCDDYIIYVRPDPEYRFMLASDPWGDTPSVDEKGKGNFNQEHQGDLENEIEQWMVPVGYRPIPGDRIQMYGRWVIDCGHQDWHAEIHPYEAYAASHSQRHGGAAAETEVATTIVVTADYWGEPLEFDLWAPPRPDPFATLQFARDSGGREEGLQIEETLEPAKPDNPNHLHVRIFTRAGEGVHTGDWNEVHPTRLDRRLATKYHVWWKAANQNAQVHTNQHG